MKTPGGTLKQVSDVVNKGAGQAEPMKGMKEEEELNLKQLSKKEETSSEEVVAETEEEPAESMSKRTLMLSSVAKNSPKNSKKRQRPSLKQQLTLRFLKSKRHWKDFQYAEKLRKRLLLLKSHSLSVLTPTWKYVADEWFEENALAVDAGLKTEMTESFLEGMKGLFEKHYVTIPEDKYDVLESMVEKLDDMETKLNEQIRERTSH